MRTWKRCVRIVAVVVGGTLVWNVFTKFQPSAASISFTEFLHDVDAGRVTSISIDGNEVVGVNTRTGPFKTYTPRGEAGFLNRLLERDVDVSVAPEGFWSSRCAPWIVLLILTQIGGLLRRTERISSTA